ncbi:hypothetical protein AB0F93_03415 [Micromonospora tulbaghiae]|uniref:hypothetical protein n=1 Tax=Micromonospora tulbaghiae TaxID=479978 RepID=UPI003326B1C5
MTDAAAANDSWDCPAYGPGGKGIGAICFVAEPGHRACRTEQECGQALTRVRQRVYRRMNERAAAGDPTFAYLADQFGSPTEILGGPDERPDTD